MEKNKAADEIKRIVSKLVDTIDDEPDRAHSAVATLKVVSLFVYHIETGRFEEAGKKNKGRISPIRKAVNLACSKLSTPTVVTVINFLLKNSCSIEENECDDIKDIPYILQNDIAVKIQEIAWHANIVYYEQHHQEKTICFKTIANYIRDYFK